MRLPVHLGQRGVCQGEDAKLAGAAQVIPWRPIDRKLTGKSRQARLGGPIRKGKLGNLPRLVESAKILAP
jgi:hypothetical protein